MLFFGLVLRKNKCYIKPSKVDFRLFGEIIKYCAPMAIFIIVNSINRDLDKYLVSMMTDTETLAMYANASKQLPFDIIMSSFATVLFPHIIRLFAEDNKREVTKLCRHYFEVAYVCTGMLCFAALSAAPQLMKLLYSDKYTDGLSIFCVYIIVDFLRFANITTILSSAGKTKWLMALGVGSIVTNAFLNFHLYDVMGLVGPAVSTLIVTALAGIIMLYLDVRVLKARIFELFNFKYLLLFVLETAVLTVVFSNLGRFLDAKDVHYFVNLVIVAGSYVVIMALLNFKKLISDMRKINAESRVKS